MAVGQAEGALHRGRSWRLLLPLGSGPEAQLANSARQRGGRGKAGPYCVVPATLLGLQQANHDGWGEAFLGLFAMSEVPTSRLRGLKLADHAGWA